MWPKRWGVALLVAMAGLIATVLLLPPSSATFTSPVNVPATIAASATFPGQPKLITDKGPVFYHRMEDTQAATVGSAATDTINSPGTGVYGSATNGSSLWWRFDEAAGATSFADLSGAVNTASINGSATAGGAGPMGSAVTLGNSSSLSSFASPFRADRSFTMSVWFNIGSTVPTTTRIGVLSMTGNSSGTPNGAGTFARSDAMIIADTPANCASASPCWAFAMAGDPQNAATAFDVTRGTSSVVANTWVHLTAVFDKAIAKMTLYVNGTAEGIPSSHPVPGNAATNAGLDAGRYRDSSFLGTTGGTAQIGETRTWRRALSAAETTQLVVRPTARYAFNEATGSATTYTTVANATGTPGTVSRSSVGAPAGSATLAAGREGNAFTVPSTNGGWVSGPNAQLNTTMSFVVSAFVRLVDNSVDRTYFSANNGLMPVVVFGYTKNDNRWTTTATTAISTVSVQSNVTVPVLNQWVHLVVIYDDYNNLLRMYVDGTAQTSAALVPAPMPGSAAAMVGARLTLNTAISDFWAGQIDDVRLYNGYPLFNSSVTDTSVQTFVNLLNPGLSAEVPGGLRGSTKTGHAGSTAVAFGGTSNGYNSKYAVTNATSAFTVECLIRVASGHNGVIAGFAAPGVTTGLGGSTSDRLLYVDSAGKVRFGVVQSGSPVTVVSAAGVDDGAWHHLTASVGPIVGSGSLAAGGLKLSLDGTVSSNAAVTAATAASGVWRWGGVPLLPLNGWPAAPNNPYLTGTIDEFAVYDKQLTDQDDLWRIYGNY